MSNSLISTGVSTGGRAAPPTDRRRARAAAAAAAASCVPAHLTGLLLARPKPSMASEPARGSSCSGAAQGRRCSWLLEPLLLESTAKGEILYDRKGLPTGSGRLKGLMPTRMPGRLWPRGRLSLPSVANGQLLPGEASRCCCCCCCCWPAAGEAAAAATPSCAEDAANEGAAPAPPAVDAAPPALLAHSRLATRTGSLCRVCAMPWSPALPKPS